LIESLREIGSLVLFDDPHALPIRKDLLYQSRRDRDLLIKIVFNLDEGKVSTIAEEISEDRLREYMWIGNPMGNKPQVVLTTDNPQYLLDPAKKKKFAFQAIQDLIETDHLRKSEHIDDLYRYIRLIRERFFDSKEREKIHLNVKELKKEGSLFTPSVVSSGRIIDLAKHPGYREVISYYLFERGRLRNGRCHVCGREEEVFIDPAFPEGRLLKIYVTDKIGFLSNMSDHPESLIRTFAICRKCRRELILGLNYIENELSMKLGDSFIYVIPNIYGGMTKALLDTLSDKVKRMVGLPMRSLRDMEEFLEGYAAEFGGRVYMLNIVFGRPSKSSFEFLGFIQNVPTTRLIEIHSVGFSVISEVQKAIDLLVEVSFTINGIYGIFPLKKGEWRPFIDLLNALYHGSTYPIRELHERGVRLARIHRFGDGSFNIKPGDDFTLARDLIRFNILMILLRRVGVIMRGDAGEDTGTDYDEYFSISGYDEGQKALFLMGVLIAKIGRAQFARGSREGSVRSKPILEKINFSGMSKERVMTLANQIMEGLKNYRLLTSENEELYGRMKVLLDRSLGRLNDPVENVFYILSGYGFESLRRREKGGEKDGSE